MGGLGGSQARGSVACALGAVTSFRDECRPGNDCTVSFNFHSCLLDDANASGRIKFTVRERTTRRFDRGTVTMDFRKWQTTLDEDTVSHVDGVVEVEATRYDTRDTLLTVAEFEHGVHTLAGDVLREESVRGALRIVSEDQEDGEDITIEVLGWVDEDGDGEDDGSIVIRVKASVLEDGDYLDVRFEVEDASGIWACAYTGIEEDGEVWTSVGTCTDPSGDTVSFEGVVSR